MNFVIDHSYLIPLLPLLGAAIAGFFGARYLRGNSHWPIWAGVGASAVLSLVLLFGMLGRWGDLSHGTGGHAAPAHATTAGAEVAAPGEAQPAAQAQAQEADEEVEEDEAPLPPPQPRHLDNTIGVRKHFYTWVRAGDPNPRPGTNDPPAFVADAAFFFDPLTAVMLCVITCIGFLITVFAKGYMAGEAGYFRFFAYLGLFIFMMTILVLGDNLVMLYLGWEGVGLCSYLLIGYYYDKPSAREAAKKAFLVNRVGDFGFGLGIMLCYFAFGTVSYFGDPSIPTDGLLEQAWMVTQRGSGELTNFKITLLEVIPFLLMLGAFGKSAQFPLYVWLPDAMEGPTPVSALIHAATMVTAGVYMIVRCSTLFFTYQAPLVTITVVGAFTAIFAGSIALRQFDLKKVFAYSTVSQLGFMFVAVGVLAPVAGVFHLVTHAFFKALLFLSSGVVMHAMAGVLDMRQMSGLKKVLPKTNILMLIGCLALAGMPMLSGFFSKDEIIHAAAPRSNLLLGVLLVTAFLTAYYTFRLYFRVFQGPLVLPGAPAVGHGHAHEPADAHATASASAVQTGTAAGSGVDEHLARDPVHHGQAVHDAAHGHGHAHGQGHGHHHNHEPMVMILPLVLLAVGAAFAGYLNWPHRESTLGGFLGASPSFTIGSRNTAFPAPPSQFGQHALSGEHEGSLHIMLASGFIAIMGIGLAYVLHLSDRARAERLAAGAPAVTRLLEAKYWVDEIYQNTIVEPLRWLGRAFFAIDRYVVDGIVNVMAWVPQLSGAALKLSVQRGYLQGYAAAMLFGVAVILLLIFL